MVPFQPLQKHIRGLLQKLPRTVDTVAETPRGSVAKNTIVDILWLDSKVIIYLFFEMVKSSRTVEEALPDIP